VDPAVLIPRPETEHLVDAALDVLEGVAAPVFADVGTGSGCVVVTLLHALPAARAHATDVSAEALAVARENARRHGVLPRLSFHEGDVLAPLRAGADWGRLDAVVSNPPYVVRGDPTVEVDVRDHEPAAALYVPGADPLAVARRVAEEARAALRPGGLLALEVGMGSAPAAREALAALGYAEVRVLPDLAGIERIVTGVSARGPRAGS
jgi:release factor glutamine methyltransferase